jgi:hypothetical protein
MKAGRVLYLLLFLISTGTLSAQINDCVPIREVNNETLPFGNGEYLSYIIRYKWGAINSDIGEASFMLKLVSANGDSYYNAKLTGGTSKFYDIFFKARESYESKFSTKNLKPIYFTRDVKEGKYSMKNNIEFIQGNRVKVRIQKNKQQPRDTVIQGRECTFDVITLFYFTRSLDVNSLVRGSDNWISVVIDGELYNISYRYMGKENKRIPGMGPRKTLKFSAKVIAGQFFSGKEEMQIWVSEDNNKIPLYFETPVKIGKVSGRLSRYANLKFQTDNLNLY